MLKFVDCLFVCFFVSRQRNKTRLLTYETFIYIISSDSFTLFIRTVQMSKIDTFIIRDDGEYLPNNNQLPVIIYHQVFERKTVSACQWEDLFKKNHFGNSWRDGIYPFHHYHSTAHEVLGCYAGRARVRLGGDNEQVRRDVELTAGDCVLIPIGVAHKNLDENSDLALVGAYDLDGNDVDMNYGKNADERKQAEENMKQVKIPRLDPVLGNQGGLNQYWKTEHNNHEDY